MGILIMSYTYNIIKAIDAKSGKNDKLKILQDVKKQLDDMDPTSYQQIFIQIVENAYNPLINFYIKPVRINDNTSGAVDIENPKTLHILHRLSAREVTGNQALQELQNYYNTLTVESQHVMKCILDKSFDCGMSLKTINKVWDNLIPDIVPMTCQPFNDKNSKRIKFPCYAQIKYDGSRILVFVDLVADTVRYQTRNGKTLQIENNELDNDFKLLAERVGEMGDILNISSILAEPKFVFDGELHSGVQDRVKSNAIATKFVRGTASTKEHESVRIVLWDFIPFRALKIKKYDLTYKDRYGILQDRLIPTDNISIANTVTLHSIDECLAYNEQAVNLGEEGIIVKNINAPWVAKRSFDCIKMKEELESELIIKEVVVGQGKYSESTGALYCESSDGIVTVSVGTGLSDSQREEFWENSKKYIDKVITIRHNGLITDTNGLHSLYLPRLIEVRHDKDEADDYSKIVGESKRK